MEKWDHLFIKEETETIVEPPQLFEITPIECHFAPEIPSACNTANPFYLKSTKKKASSAMVRDSLQIEIAQSNRIKNVY